MAVAALLVAPPGRVLALSLAALAALMLALWALSLRLRDVSIVDPVWGPAFVLVAVVCALAGDGDGARRWLLVALTAAWGLRLGAHLLARKRREHGEDRRYAAMRSARGARGFALWSLVAIFLLQGALVAVVSLPLQVAAGRPGGLGLLVIPGLVVYALGLGFEAVGDEQLRRFKADSRNHGQVMDRGLWRYTRHPNYFGDACVWWGLWLIALPAGGTWWTVVSPVLMTLLLVRVSGKALLERDLVLRRPGYGDYIRRTSGFFPLPPRPAAPPTPVPAGAPRGESAEAGQSPGESAEAGQARGDSR
jgi:steroid 5-alpha reductase family enzyme